MRIYKGIEKETFIHVHISRHGETTKKLILAECDKRNATIVIWGLLPSLNVNPFNKGNKLTIKLYAKTGSEKGCANNIYAHGMTVSKVYELIANHLNKPNHESRKS